MGAARQYGAGDAGSAFDGSARVSADMSQVWSGRPFVGALAEDDRVQIPITQLLGPGYSGGLGDGNLGVAPRAQPPPPPLRFFGEGIWPRTPRGSTARGRTARTSSSARTSARCRSSSSRCAKLLSPVMS